MSEYNGNELNSWLSIWIYPGITMRWIQQKDPATWSSSWPVLPVFSEILVSASRLNLGEHMAIPVILAMAGRPRSFMGMAVMIINLRFVVVGRFLAVR